MAAIMIKPWPIGLKIVYVDPPLSVQERVLLWISQHEGNWNPLEFGNIQIASWARLDEPNLMDPTPQGVIMDLPPDGHFEPLIADLEGLQIGQSQWGNHSEPMADQGPNGEDDLARAQNGDVVVPLSANNIQMHSK